MTKDITSTYQRVEGGNVEIMFTIPAEIVLGEKEKVLLEFAQEMTVPGFRKGKAPISKVEAAVSEEKLTEHILSHLLPHAFSQAVEEHKIQPAIYPKFEAVKIVSTKNVANDSVWEIKATTCELPKVTLPKDLKKRLKAGNGKKEEKNDDTILRSLVEAVDLKIPKMLIDEEVNVRLSQVLERIEKLGLTLEGYLKSVGKDVKKLRDEYQEQAKNSISVELILNKVAEEEKIVVDDKEVDEFIKTTGQPIESVSKEQREMLARIVARRKALESLQK